MTTAVEKNRQAFAGLLGDSALANRVAAIRIGVISGPDAAGAAGRLLAEALGDVLGRLWLNIDATGPVSQVLLHSAQSAAKSASFPSKLNESWAPPYDVVIAIGTTASADAGPVVRIGADGWVVTAGTCARVGDSPIPVGPVVAAALAGAEVFKHVFSGALGETTQTWLGDLEWDAWSLGHGDNPPPLQPLRFSDAYVFGAGAVTHGLIWALQRWPAPVEGSLRLVDHDSYDDSNGQRYCGMTDVNIGNSKATVVAERLKLAHRGLIPTPYPVHLNAYFDAHEPVPNVHLAIVGLDSAESRRHVALKLPRRTVNMWTERQYLGAARFGFNADWPCLMCAYPEALRESRDEAAVVSAQTGLGPARVRHLLDTAEGLSPQDAAVVAQRGGLSQDDVLGRPLRTALHQLCATGHVALPDTNREVDVPFAFSSLLAGSIGFVNLVRELWAHEDPPSRWVYNVLRRPNPGLTERVSRRPHCLLCGNDDALSVIRELAKT